MKVWTGRVGYAGSDGLDVTVKSGNKAFAPTWDMVMGHKRGQMSDSEYVERYYTLMRRSYREQRQTWDWLLSQDEVTLLCYCAKGKFCHRTLLAEILVKLGAQYMGER